MAPEPNAKDSNGPFKECVHHLFNDIVQKYPDLEAVCAHDGSLSYSELDSQATILASRLIEGGIGPEVLVCVAMEKSKWAIVAMVAVLKAGGGFFCLDLNHPMNRKETILIRSQAKLVLVSATSRERLPDITQTLVVDMDLINEQNNAQLKRGLDVSPENICFVLFSSGSTGTPKGIVHEHRAFCASVRKYGKVLQLQPGTRLFQYAAFTFDVSINDIFGTLLWGGCVCLPSEADRMDRIAESIRTLRVDVGCLTPTVAKLLTPQDVGQLKMLVLVGEAVTKKLLDTWAENLQLGNMYGPAEVSMWTICQEHMTKEMNPSNVGHTGLGRCWVTDADDCNRLVPLGEVGELLVEGPHLARGYLRDEELTRSKFIIQPTLSKDGQSQGMTRYLRTGDLVTENEDGTFNFVGRCDTQIKIHGQRVEVGEIEHWIQGFDPILKDTTVDLSYENTEGTKPILTAFFSLKTEDNSQKPTAAEVEFSALDELRSVISECQLRVEQQLPAYMVPRLFIPLSHLPVNNSGKRDRRLLRSIFSSLPKEDQYRLRGSPDTKKVELSDPIEASIQYMMEEVLSIPHQSIELDDNFFNLGGDSVRAIMLVSMAQKQNINLSVQTILRFPTIKGLCKALKSASSEVVEDRQQGLWFEDYDMILTEVRKQHALNEIESIYPCTPIQEGLFALSLKASGQLTQHIVTLPSVEESKFCELWESIVSTHDILRTIFAMTTAGMVQVVANQPVKWYHGTSLNTHLEKDRNNPIAFGTPSSRYAFINDEADGNQYFVFSAHHSVLDAWTLEILLDSIRLGLAKSADQIKRPRTKYSSFVRWVQGQDLETAKIFWSAQLEGGSPKTFPAASYSAVERPIQWETMLSKIDLTSLRDRQSLASAYPPSILLRAAWSILMASYTNSKDVVFGATVNGRTAPLPGMSEIAGPTLATVPIRVTLNDGTEKVSSFLDRLNEQLVSMIPYEHIGTQNILKLCPQAEEVCNFQTLIIIQSANHNSSSEVNIMSLTDHEVSDFMPYPLVLECTLEKDGILPIKASFDPTYITDRDMKSVLQQFEHVLGQLAKSGQNTSISGIEMLQPFEGIPGNLKNQENPIIQPTMEMDENAAKRYWTTQLQGGSPASFPAPFSGSKANRVFKSHQQTLSPSPKDIQVSLQTDAATLIRAAWTILMSQYTASDDIIFGSILSGSYASSSSVESAESTVAIVPTRVCLVQTETVPELFQRIKDLFISMAQYSRIGLKRIQTFATDSTLSAVFQTLLDIRVKKGDKEDEVSLQTEVTSLGQFQSYPLTLRCSVSSSNVDLLAVFDEEILPEESVSRLIQQLEFIMHQLLGARPTELISQLNLINESDMQQIEKWNQTSPEPIMNTLHGMVEGHRDSEAEAVCSWDGSFTYRQLYQYSSLLCHQLVQNGVKPGNVVLVCLEKSKWAIVSLLAILKCGATFVPIDIAATSDRVQQISSQTGAIHVICQQSTASLFNNLFDGITIMNNDYMTALIAAQPSEQEECIIHPHDVAYILFTSGTSGNAKGVVVQHQAICTSLISQGRTLELTPTSRVLQFASFTFDVSILEIFATLIYGGCVCIPSEEDRLSNLAPCMRELQVNWTFLTPSVLQLLRPEDLPALKTLVYGGEAGRQEIVYQWGGKVKLFQGYGPTECCVLCLMAEIPPMGKATNLGHAVSCRAWVVDFQNHGRLAPIGALGELVIEGPILAKGYFNDTEKTRQAFVSGPQWSSHIISSADAPIRRYKTGDLVRYNQDGTITYIMRASDDQVKINGQRVDLGDVESFVKVHLSINDQVMVDLLPASNNSPATLVGFIHSQDQSTLKVAEGGKSMECQAWSLHDTQRLQQKMKMHAPTYMIPAKFFEVSGVPITSAGKVDRRQLRSLLKDHDLSPISGGSGGPPITAMEILLHSLWSTILKLSNDRIGLDDSFFAQGGDSIKAMHLTSMARQNMINLTVPQIFQNPKLRDMALVVTSIEDSEQLITRDPHPFSLLDDKNAMQIRDEISQLCPKAQQIVDIYPCTPLQEALMSSSFKIAESYTAQHVISLPDSIDLEKFMSACSRMIQKVPVLRTFITETESVGMMQVVLEAIPTIEISTCTLSDYLDADSKIPMSLGDLLSRFKLVIDENETKPSRSLIWTAHHAVYDGWTMSMMLQILNEEYRACQSLVPMNFNRYVAWIKGQDLELAKKFWESELTGLKPTNYPAQPKLGGFPVVNSYLNHRINLPEGQSWVQASSVTIATVIQASWALLLAQYVNSSDVTFGTVLAGREVAIPGVENIAGPTIATIPLRVHADQAKPLNQFLTNLQDRIFKASSFAYLGLQEIQRINSDAQTACKFKSLVVVQPSSTSTSSSNLFNVTSKPLKSEGFDSYALNLEFTPESTYIDANMLFDKNWIEPKQVQRLAQQLETTIQNILSAPFECTLGKLSSFSNADKSEVQRWNVNTTEEVKSNVYAEFQKQVHLLPQEEAVCSREGSLTYEELDRLSTGLAIALKSLNVGPETPVLFCMEKSIWAIVAILAIIKAGGVIVPLDLSHPRSRLEIIAKASRADVILLSKALENTFADLATNSLVVAEDVNKYTSLPVPDTFSPTMLSSESALYIIFTSGTTGLPKGVVVEHGPFCTVANAQYQVFPRGPGDRAFQFFAFCFDVAMEEILFTLMRGGAVCMPSENERRTDIVGTFNALGANWAAFTPSVLATISPEDLHGLKTLTVGGEPMTAKLLSTWADKCRLRNGYGPTETICISTMNINPKPDSIPENIGQATGPSAWVVNPENHDVLTPVGAIGELLLSGKVLARGYLNDADKTAAAFIYDPAWAEDLIGSRGNRFYKTGDLVRYDTNGDLIFIGRKDNQQKVRGQRFETGEVEHHLKRTLGDSAEVVVEVIKPSNQEMGHHLAAFITIENIHQQHGFHAWDFERAYDDDFVKMVRQAKQELSQQIPSHMIPQLYIPVRSWPLGLTGKVDRAKLRDTVSKLSPLELTRMSRLGMEDQLADVLDIGDKPARSISRKIAYIAARGDNELYEQLDGRNFIITDAGLDSINIASLSAYIKKTFGRSISFDVLYKNGLNIRQLAEMIMSTALLPNHLGDKIDFQKEISSLEEYILAQNQTTAAYSKKAETFFLTGATGYLGSEVLRQLLGRGQTRMVIVLVRASSEEDGYKRVTSAAERGRWWRDEYKSKVGVWLGDLDLPHLGLNDPQWQTLQGRPSSKDEPTFDVIIHSGARVHWGHSYQALKAANVLSTVDLLSATIASNPRPRFAYISGGIDHSHLSLEDDKDIIHGANGYSKSKMVSDRLVCAIAEKLNPHASVMSVIRPGLIIGTATEGVVNVDDYFWRLVTGVIDLGKYSSEDGWIGVETVDKVAEEIIHRTCGDGKDQTDEENPSSPKSYVSTIDTGIMMNQIWGLLIGLGYQLSPTKAEDWLANMEKRIEVQGESHPLWPVAEMLQEDKGRFGGPAPLEEDLKLLRSSSEAICNSILTSINELIQAGYLPLSNGQKIISQGKNTMFQRSHTLVSKTEVSVQVEELAEIP